GLSTLKFSACRSRRALNRRAAESEGDASASRPAIEGFRSAMIPLPGNSYEPLLMSWFEKIMPSRIKTERRTRSVPEGLWIKCPACDAVLYRAELERNLYVCPKCSHHMRIGARERLESFLDANTGVEIGASISPEDPLRFRDSKRYKDRLAQAQ